MGKPVDVLEIDGHATSEQVKELERMMCNEIPYLGNSVVWKAIKTLVR
jgi:phosphoribulokinase